MAVKYKLIQKKDFSKDAPKDGKKYYASIVSNGTVDLEELCESISEETALTSADVKSCPDRLPRIIARHLREGRNVQLGELGNIRLSLGSKGSDTMKAFNAATMMKKPNILFTPGRRLRDAQESVVYSRVRMEGDEDSGSDSESPGEI